MADFLFYLFAALTVFSAVLVVFSRSAVNAAMFLLLSFVGMAAMFVLLEAYFLAVLQVLVYAGAVVVLFLFIIMLLDVREEAKRHFKKLSVVAGVIGGALVGVGAVATLQRGHLASPDPSGVPALGGELKNFGYQLFTTYLLPLQITGFLLLIAMLGVIVLSKKLEADPEVRRQDAGGKP